MTHTPTPWNLGAYQQEDNGKVMTLYVIWSSSYPDIVLADGLDKETAEQIIHEHNSHAALVEALENAVKKSPFKPIAGGIEVKFTMEQVKAMQAALALAKGE